MLSYRCKNSARNHTRLAIADGPDRLKTEETRSAVGMRSANLQLAAKLVDFGKRGLGLDACGRGPLVLFFLRTLESGHFVE